MNNTEMRERKEIVENVAEQFVNMDDHDKAFVAGYMFGKAEERQKWSKQQEASA